MGVLADVPFDHDRELAATVGAYALPEASADEMSYRQYAERQERPEEYQAQMAEGQPSLILFWFWQSPRYLETNGADHVVQTNYISSDPPLNIPGMVKVVLDPRGRLIYLEAVPPEVEHRPLPVAAADWGALFRAAGFDPAHFTPAAAQWTPPAGFDARAAWTGSYPPHTPRTPLRIEAAAWRGKPVYFDAFGPWRKPLRTEGFPMPAEARGVVAVLAVLRLLLLAVAVLLAWRNLRMGRGDTRGAFRLAIFVFACDSIKRLVIMHHVPAALEETYVMQGLSLALLNAGALWSLYVALEPYVRRRWPQSLIGWARLLNGGVRDPLVGAQLLIGCTIGIAFSLLYFCWDVVFVRYGLFRPYPLLIEALLETRRMTGQLLTGVWFALVDTLGMFFLFFLLRALLRRQWLAWAVWVGVWTGLTALGGELPAVNAIFAVFLFGIAALVAMRLGLLPLVAAHFTLCMLILFPMTANFSVWYAGRTLFALAAVLALAAYSLRTALAGRPLLKEDFL